MHELNKAISRRRLGGWQSSDPSYDYGDMHEVIRLSKLKQDVSTDPTTGVRAVYWITGQAAYWASNGYIGSKFEPFGGNNYLYGFKAELAPLENYRILHEVSHPQHKLWVSGKRNIDAAIRKAYGGRIDVFDVVSWAIKNQDPSPLLLYACDDTGMKFEDRVYLLNMYFDWLHRFLEDATKGAMFLFPVVVFTQLYTLGWKRTLAAWVTGQTLP